MPTTKTFGVVPTEAQLETSGLGFVRGLVSGTLPLNSMAKALNYDVVDVAEVRVVVSAPASDKHLNPSGTIHGGFAAALLDTCMGLAH